MRGLLSVAVDGDCVVVAGAGAGATRDCGGFREPFSAVPAAPEDYAGATLTLAAGAAAGIFAGVGNIDDFGGRGAGRGDLSGDCGGDAFGFCGDFGAGDFGGDFAPAAAGGGVGAAGGGRKGAGDDCGGSSGGVSPGGVAERAGVAGFAGADRRTADGAGGSNGGVLRGLAGGGVEHNGGVDGAALVGRKFGQAELCGFGADGCGLDERGCGRRGRGRFRTTAIAEIAGISLASPDFAAGAFLDLDPADAFEIGANGVVVGARPPEAVYELTAGWTAEGMLGLWRWGLK